MKREVKISTQTLYHSLVHFFSVSSEVESTLLHAGYTLEQIEGQLSSVGSKFYSSFAESPHDVIATIEQMQQRSIFDGVWDSDNRCRLSFELDRKVGVVNVVKVSDLTPVESASITEVYRGENLIRVARSERTFETNLCQIIVGGDAHNPELITLFPGILTPPLPMADYMSDPFWSQYLFIMRTKV